MSRTSLYKFNLIWLAFFILAVLLRFAALQKSFYLNEDAALILAAKRLYEQGKLWDLFSKGYGPDVIRPLQVLGMLIDFWFLKLGPLGSLVLGLVILAFSQTVLFLVAFDITRSYKSILGILLIGISTISLEPTLWISDRHDLYLLFFGSMSLLFFSRFLSSLNNYIYLLCYVFSLWLAFWSNEKAVVLPIITPMAMALMRPRNLKQITLVALSGLLTLTAYFIYRYSILGTFIGGYHDSLLPDQMSLLSILFTFAKNTFGLLAWQSIKKTPILFAVQLAAWILFFFNLIYVGSRSFNSRARLVLVILVSSVILLISLAPTFRYAMLMPYGSQLNSRLLWLPWITLSFTIAVVVPKASRTGIISLLIAFICLLPSSIRGVLAYKSAYAVTKRMVYLADPHCNCVPNKNNIAVGLPRTIKGVNTFSEDQWFRNTLELAHSKPTCKQDYQHCELLFSNCRKGRCNYAVYISDEGKLKEMQSLNYNVELSNNTVFEITHSQAFHSSEVTGIEGIAYHKDLGRFDKLVLFSGQQIVWTGPTGIKTGKLENGLKARRLGFFMPAEDTPYPISLYGIKERQTFFLFSSE